MRLERTSLEHDIVLQLNEPEALSNVIIMDKQYICIAHSPANKHNVS